MISKETQDRLNYSDQFIKNGGTVTELLKDETFQELVEKEREKTRESI
jgi:hypothetical protein